MEAPQRPLIAVAEGIEAERVAIRRLLDARTEQHLGLLGNLIRASQANASASSILRWLVEHGAMDAGAELDYAAISADPWVNFSESTARRSVRFWQSVRCPRGPALVVEERWDARGREVFSIARLDLENVKEYLVPDSVNMKAVTMTPITVAPVTVTEPPSPCQRSCHHDGASVTMTDNRHASKEELTEAQFQERKRVMIERLATADRSAAAPQAASHDHDTIDIEGKNLSCHSTMIMDHGHGEHPGVRAIASPLRALVEQFADPKEQKRRLVARIQAVVSDPRMNAAIPRIAADLVLFQAVPIADLEHILVDLEALREAGSLRCAGSFFLKQARKMASRHGLPWLQPATPQQSNEDNGEFS